MSVVTALICEGDSLTASAAYGLSGQIDRVAYPFAAASYTPATVPGAASFASISYEYWPFSWNGMIVLNRAVSGSRLTDLTTRAAAQVDALINTSYPGNKAATGLANNRAARKYILSVLVGTNDAPVGTETTFCASLATYLNARLTAAGGSILALVVGTLLPRCDGIAGGTAYTQAASNAFDTMRHTINNILKGATWKATVNAKVLVIADFGGDATIGADGAALSYSQTLTPSPVSSATALFCDGVHPTTLGYSYMTPLWTAAVNQVKAIL